MGKLAKFVSAIGVILLLVGCVTNSEVITDPPGLNVAINGVDFGKSPCEIQSTGTTFGEYQLTLTDDGGNVLYDAPLAKNVRVWGIFWPPYGVFYNMYEFFPRYSVSKATAASGQDLWVVTTH